MHVNGVFLEPDDANWDAHASTWNENCIFCHNTAPAPGLELAAGAPARSLGARASQDFDSRVGELGIACEACHGPGEAHVAKHASPAARYAAHFDGERDDTIVAPARSSSRRRRSRCAASATRSACRTRASVCGPSSTTGPTLPPRRRARRARRRRSRAKPPSLDPREPGALPRALLARRHGAPDGVRVPRRHAVAVLRRAARSRASRATRCTAVPTSTCAVSSSPRCAATARARSATRRSRAT